MSDMDLEDIFGSDSSDDEEFTGFDELDDLDFSSDDFDEGLLDEEEEGGLNRAFLFAGVALIVTFLAIVCVIVVLAVSDDGDDQEATANAIRLTNAARETEVAAVLTQEQQTLQAENAQTATAAWEQSATANASATQVWETYAAQQDATATWAIIEATNTEIARLTSVAMTISAEMTANAPTLVPTRAYDLSVSGDNPLPAGLVINFYRDNGDQRFSEPPTPTPLPSPTPTQTPTNTPSRTPTPTNLPGTATETPDPATRSAEVDAFGQTATARAEMLAPGSPSPTLVAIEPTFELSQVVTSTDGNLSLRVPDGWVSSEQAGTAGTFYFGDSDSALESRVVVAEVPIVDGLGGSIIPQTVAELGFEEVNRDVLSELLTGWTEVIGDSGGQILEEVQEVELDDGTLLLYVVYQQGNEQGFGGYMGFADSVALVTATGTDENFENNRDLLMAIMESIQIAGDEEAPVGYRFDRQDVVLMRVSANTSGSGILQQEPTATPEPTETATTEPAPTDDAPTATSDAPATVEDDAATPEDTPAPESDEYLGSVIVGPDGTLVFTLPGDPGTYWADLALPPGTYTFSVGGQAVDITVPVGGTVEETVSLSDRTLIIRVTAIDLPTNTPEPGTGGGLSPFLQTATAVARQGSPPPDTPEVTPGGPTAIPQSGLFSDGLDSATPGGLRFLALMGAGLIGLVFVVRRLRSQV